ncbi:MAG: tRNA (adenosine(37)-N6)-threonylcarbamoyltransferase complex dimerization subunit type 1 TsaB [Burkholderiales bacterium]|jgi:tRNA threonylcarbamoyladenosine biosynthesis protein TsaB|nr:tRNA (adenosine(37)-N6)-threonylcarbamoyltransferase complex dimerization subunit type 1 TsaB [Burkholderiales bacterium]
MSILALETSTHWLSVAAGDATGWVTRDVEVGPGHSGRILPLIQEALAEAGMSLKQLDAIAFGAGPGSFTGVRIACSVAQGLALGANLPLIPMCSLLAIAEAARIKHDGHNLERVCTVADARMREVYAAAWHYRAGAWHEVMAPMVARPEEATACFRKIIETAENKKTDKETWSIAGDGLAVYPELGSALYLTSPWKIVEANLRPAAQAVGVLALAAWVRGDVVTAAEAAPLYVRQRVALTSAERAAGEVL